MQFCAVTAALVIGATAERGRVVPAMVFTFFWATLVYCPLAHWAWAANGWGFKYGVLDYAGGGPVEIGSGVSALAYSWVLGRRNEQMMLNFRPHNISLITLGVDDLEAALRFYRDGLGLATEGIVGRQFEHGAVAFFDLQPGLRLALWPRASLAHDATGSDWYRHARRDRARDRHAQELEHDLPEREAVGARPR